MLEILTKILVSTLTTKEAHPEPQAMAREILLQITLIIRQVDVLDLQIKVQVEGLWIQSNKRSKIRILRQLIPMNSMKECWRNKEQNISNNTNKCSMVECKKGKDKVHNLIEILEDPNITMLNHGNKWDITDMIEMKIKDYNSIKIFWNFTNY